MVRDFTVKKQLDAEMAAILEHLPGWQLDPQYAEHWWCAAIKNDEGMGLQLNVSKRTGRWTITGFWPYDNSGKQWLPDRPKEISIDRDRQPEKIAADITRRFLPWYTDAFAEQVERARQADNHRRGQENLAKELMELLGNRAYRTDRQPEMIELDNLSLRLHHSGEVSLTIRYTDAETIKVTIRAYLATAYKQLAGDA